MKIQLLTLRKLFVLASQEFLLILPPTPFQKKSEPTKKGKSKKMRQLVPKRIHSSADIIKVFNSI